ncbi:MAG: sulfatase [Akkermansiaceae bacterium]
MKILLTILITATVVVSPLDAGEILKPNILFIAIDDLNDWIGCLDGHPQALTPNIDQVAKRGILFTNAHCASPACRPSRSAIFTGLMPNKTNVWSNESKSLDQLMPNVLKFPTPFEKVGYKTIGTGKLLHKNSQSAFSEYRNIPQRWSPISHEQSEYTRKDLHTKGSKNPRHLVTDSTGRDVILPLNRMPSDRAPKRKAGESFDWGPWDVPDKDFGDTQITDWAIKRLGDQPEEPLFLALGYYRPHIPLWAPKRFFERFKNDPGRLPPIKNNDLEDLSDTAKKWALEAVTAGSHASVVKHKQWSKAIEGYLASVTYVDEEIGRLLTALDSSAYSENTIVILWSDHGWHLGEKEHWGKWTGWERSTRVPMIIVPPKNRLNEFAPAGSRCHQPVSLIDIFPTLMDLCGIPAPKNLDGQTLVPLLKNPAMNTGRKVRTSFDQGNHSIRSDRWRYILYQDGSEELYDHQTDPIEWNNLAKKPKHRPLIKTLRGDL